PTVQSVQNGLVGNLPGESGVLRCNLISARAHKGTAPVRRGSRHVRSSVRPGAIQVIADRLVRARKHERPASEHGTQEDLQSAKSSDVVEGCPDGGLRE